MPRVNTAFLKYKANLDMDSYMRQRCWHWVVHKNYAVAVDYAIRLLNRHPRDPLALVVGEIAGDLIGQDVFSNKCHDASKRLCFVKEKNSMVELFSENSRPSSTDVESFLQDTVEMRMKNNASISESSSSSLPDELLVVQDSCPTEKLNSIVRRSAARASREPLVEMLEPERGNFGRGLYARKRVNARTALLMDDPIVVYRLNDKCCSYCLGSFSGKDGVVACPHCETESYCSVECREAAWSSYHACGCASHNKMYGEWASSLQAALHAGNPSAPDGLESRAALACLAVGKLCAMATMQQCHPLALDGINSLRGIAEYDPTTALSEVGAMAVTLADSFHQTHLFMEEILSLFALVQTNEFLLPNGMAVYQVLSLLNHSCTPNCTISGTGSRNRQLVTIQDVRDGEQLFIDYNSALTTKLAYEERKALCAQRHFQCYCSRCVRQL